MKTVAIIQARMGSNRLPGKVLKRISGRTMLEHILMRIKSSQVDEVVVATTTAPVDAQIAQACHQYGVASYRGSEEDVLARFYEAAQQFKADVVVRITGDCPLIDPNLIDQLLERFKSKLGSTKSVDYMSNTLKRTFPRGLDTEVFTFACLKTAHLEARQPFEREHVTPFIYQHPEQFTLEDFVGREDQAHYRWTVDTQEDFEFVQKIYEALYQEGKIFTTRDTLELLEKTPALAKINAHVEQKKN